MVIIKSNVPRTPKKHINQTGILAKNIAIQGVKIIHRAIF
jgi:hypothetical protein